MANLICVRLNKGDAPSWGFRLQGGKDFGTSLVVQKVIGGSPAERAGLIAGDTVIKINNTDVYNLRHKDAQDVILRAGNAFDVAIQRGGSTWKPNVVPVGSISTVPSAAPLSNHISPVTHTSLAASKQDSIGSIGTGHNVSAKPYHQLNGGPKVVNKQYNSPLPIYSEQSIAETLSAQTEVLANGVLGVNFKKNEKSYNAANSEVFRMVQEADKEPRDYEAVTRSNFYATHSHAIGGQSTAVHTTPTADHISQEGTDLQQSEPDEKSSSAANQQITKCSDCDRVLVGVFVRIKDKNLHVECFKCATCGSSLKNVGYYNLNNKLYCDVHAKLAARSNPPAPNLQPITIPPGGKIPSGTISAALSSHSLPSPSSLSPNYLAAPYQPGSSYTTSKPFSSVAAPLSPTYTPISPTSTPYTESRGVQNLVWPPIPNEPDIPTASPLYFPPPSQIQAHQKLLLDDTEIRTDEKAITTEEEVSFINEFAKETNMSLCSSEVCMTGRRSAMECSETISDTIDRQILVESIVQSRPKSPPIEPKPRRTSGDVNVTFTISEAQLKQGAYQNITSGGNENKEVKVCPKETLTHNAIANVNSKQGTYKSVSSEVSEIKELKTCLRETQSQSLASMYEKKIKVENTVPHQWESPMVTALTVASSKPYTNLSEVEQFDTFSEIPTTTSHTPLASALAVAPAAPFTPASSCTLGPVPLPDETVPYFPPEHPIIPKPKNSDDEKKEKKVAKKVYGKKKEELDLLFQDLPTPPVEKISMLAALTTAPDRSYSPLNADSVTSTTTSHEEVTSKAETNINTEIQKTKAVVATKTLEDYSFISHTSKPILKTYVPFPTYQANEGSNTCTTVSKIDEENQIRQETSKSVNEQVSEKLEVSKNVQSSENFTNVSPGLGPMIQLVRSTFETSTDKVQMEMSCQYLGDSVPQRQIIERHTTTDVNQQKAVKHLATEEHKTSSEMKKDQQKSTHSTSQQKTIEKRAANEHKEQQKQLQNMVDMRSKNALAAGVSSQVTESVLLQKATSNFESEGHSVTSEQFRTGNKAYKEPLTVIKPGESILSVPQISFQPVIEDACSSTTFSSRPGSLTPSMINKPAPVLPYYQSSLVATECAPVGTNLFDPKSPAISRSPSPCIVRPPSPFATPSAALRPVSPAQGPPPNPLQSHKSVYEIKREGKVQDARSHIQTFIPQHQSKAYHARSESYKEEPWKESIVCSTNDDKIIAVRQCAKQADLFEASKLENTSVQCKRDGNLQIQRKTHTIEEYEHKQKSGVIQIETLSGSTKILEDKKATASSIGGQAVVGFHVTNPQQLKSPFLGAPEPHSKIPKRILQPDSGTKTNCPTVNSSASASVPPAKMCPNKNVTKPSISQPNLGTGGGRQAGAIGVAPKRGRGVLNVAATPGSRVPLCAQCNANIRGPFITALGKIWCPDHFICATPSCRRPLHDLGFVEEHGQLYCEYCFEQYLAPPCSKCNTKIKGDCLKAIGRNFHPECFNCVYCGKLFGNSPFFLEDAQPYCETDWNELFTTKCFACGFPVEAGDRWVEALNNNYHSQCFNCTMCKKNLEGQSFFAKGGRPFCKNHAR